MECLIRRDQGKRFQACGVHQKRNDIGDWMRGGFKGSRREMGWWECVTTGVGGAIRLLGSAAGFIAKINCIIEKIQGLIDTANAVKEGEITSAGLALAGAARSACFTPDTLVALADGTLVPIAEIEVGDAVSCLDEEALGFVDAALASPFPDHYEQADPATWRAVRLRFDGHAEVPTIVEQLLPAAWLTCSGVAVGAMVPLHIDELHISGPARVEAIRPCPEITGLQGPGRRVVTATSRRFTHQTLTLSLQEAAPEDTTCPKWSTGTTTGITTTGWTSTLGTTANHPI